MTNLRHLGLWLNDISEIPDWIGELTALTEIDLPVEPDERLLAIFREMPNLRTVTSDDGNLEFER